MSDLYQLIDRYSGSYHQRILKITDPLYQHFGITYFGYRHVTNDGAWTFLTNNPDWVSYSTSQQYYLCDPSLIDPKFVRKGVFFPKTLEGPEFQERMLKDSVELFDIDHALAVLDTNDNGYECCYFGAPTSHKQALQVYLNCLPELRQFIRYFKQETSDLRAGTTAYAIDVKALKGELYTHPKQPWVFATALPEEAKKAVRLTKREQESLDLYRLGKTAKETARILGISARTVEEYLENVKRKYRCRNKRELLQLF